MRPDEEPSEEELRARLEEELRKIIVRDVVLQTVVTLINLGGQRLGITAGTREDRDPEQTRLAIEAVRALLPLIETDAAGADQLRPVRDALSQLQLAYAREVGAADRPTEAEARSEGAEQPQEPRQGQRPTRAKSSGRLWVPPGTES